MNTNLAVAIISASATILVATFAYYSAKEREREAEWRKEKLNYYKEYFNALAACIGEQVTNEHRKRYALAFNTVGLFASQEVYKMPALISGNYSTSAGQNSTRRT
jgi:hypothetical protein